MPNPLGDHISWSVLWKKQERVIEKNCGNDLAEAIRLYDKARSAGKQDATLKANNVGFPPPVKWRDNMRVVNDRGIAWCPYCLKMRRFKRHSGFYVSGIFVPLDHKDKTRFCPLCGISTKDYHVKKWNPRYRRKVASGKTKNRSTRRRPR
jgi:uncharacterized Zn-finger protein